MQCSHCRAPIHPVVVLDIDGTLGEYHGHFHRFAEQYVGQRIPNGYDGSMEMHDWYKMSLTKYREIKLAYRQGGMKRSMPQISGANQLVRMVQREGAEVWICTTRPYLRLDNIDPDTREWLARNNIQYDGLLYSENKYERLLEIVDPARIVAVLDDLPEMCLAADQRIGRGTAMLKVAQHNMRYRQLGNRQGFVLANDLNSALDAILLRLYDWRAKHDA